MCCPNLCCVSTAVDNCSNGKAEARNTTTAVAALKASGIKTGHGDGD